MKKKAEYIAMMSNKKRCKFKKYLLIAIFLSFIAYMLLDFNIKTNLINLKEHIIDLTSLNDKNNNNNNNNNDNGNYDEDNHGNSNHHAYFVDTEGCKMPSFKMIDDKIAQFIFKPQQIYCGKPLIISTQNNELKLNMNKFELNEIYNITDIENIQCYFIEFKRKNDCENTYSKHKIYFNLLNKTRIQNAEFIKVQCKYENFGVFYTDLFAFPNIKDEEQHQHRYQQQQKQKDDKNDDYKVSVIILGIDSVSRLNFLRQMTRTATLLRKKLNAFEFYGYNKVGDNTYPNLVPVLSGLDEIELTQACLSLRQNISYDDCPFIWKRYKEAGYRTLFTEDSPNIALFNYFRKGFQQRPTDYYTRPLFLEMEKTIGRKLRLCCYLCLGNRRPIDILFDYYKKVIRKMQSSSISSTERIFSFLWTSAFTHDYLNTPSLIDYDISKFILMLNNSNLLNHTVLIVMSDHGIRWGPFRKTYQGMIEERQPLLYIVLPSWFKTLFPLAISNMRMNKHKLTTHFDLYATLIDLLDLSSITNQNIENRLLELKESSSVDTTTLPRSISLFLSVPSIRTCDMAGISSHWCTCHERKQLATNNPRVQYAARFIVKQINKKLRIYPQCRILYLNSITEANISSANRILQKVETDLDFLADITVRLQTKPGLGEFEATVRILNSNALLTGTISRTNLYGKQSYCINDYSLKMYCYCKR